MTSLNDLVVLDFTRFEAGPRCTYLLASLGAYVIKVEKAYTGDDERMYPPMQGAESIAYPQHNINKHSLGMNLRDPKAQQLLKQLLPHVDIITENFRPGTIEKMGLDWETVHSINPRIILAHNSGFGQSGPYMKRAAFDSVMQCEAGVAGSIMDHSGGNPYYIGGNPCDCISSLAYTTAILSALFQRDRTGEGQCLEVDMMSICTNMFSPELSLASLEGQYIPHPSMYPNGFYKDKDGKYLSISCPDRLWGELKSILALSALEDERFATRDDRWANKEALDELISSWTTVHQCEEICAALESHGIGSGLVKGYDELINDEYIKETSYFQNIEVPYVGVIPYPSLPFTMSGSEAFYHRAPKIGEDNAEILARFLNMPESEVEALEREGVLYHGEHSCYPPKK